MEEEETFDEEGLNTKLIPKPKSEMKGLEKLEILLTQLEIELLYLSWDTENTRKERERSGIEENFTKLKIKLYSYCSI